MTSAPQTAIMDGTSVARALVGRAAQRAAEFAVQAGRKPCLAAVIVGRDPASLTYVKMKQNRCRSTGIDSRVVTLPADTSTAELVAALHDLSSDTTVDGILLQHPVPPDVDERAAFEAIAPEKDVDGVTMQSFAAMALGTGGPVACTPGGIIRLLDAYRIDPAGSHAVVIGRSPILGKPVGMLLLTRNATVTYCHSHTRHLSHIVQGADIVVAAVGRPNFVRGAWIKSGAVVIDAGYNPGNIGDVAFDEARSAASHITPVPGGVGPMTIAVLLEQTVEAAINRAGRGSLTSSKVEGLP
jgi:methylenetetrahydrofolate dehydrogenase (NADP+) / methenyltetrahydrofolate cyclohydrolase